jgi:hypothetical protein
MVTALPNCTAYIAEIRNEYQHNVTQQIYVSTSAWAVKNV